MTQRRDIGEEYPVFVTTNVVDGEDVLQDERYARLLSVIIRDTCHLKSWRIVSYGIMPNHFHAIFYKPPAQAAVPAVSQKIRATAGRGRMSAGAAARSGFIISDLMHGIKSYFVRQMRGRFDFAFRWQPRFHLKFLTTPDALEQLTVYIAQNPVKARLPKRFSQAPYQYVNARLLTQLG